MKRHLGVSPVMDAVGPAANPQARDRATKLISAIGVLATNGCAMLVNKTS